MPSTVDHSTLPLISVITPIYNNADFLPELLENLRAQAYQPLEIMLIDDGSTDDSAAIAASYSLKTPEWRVQCIRQTNAGPSAARNAGLCCAQGDFIQFLDVDDLLPPNELLDQAHRLLWQPQLDLVGGYLQTVRLPGADPSNLFFAQAEPFLSYNLGAALFRCRVFERVGMLNPALHLAEDVDLFFRIMEAGCPLVITPEVALYYRLHERNATRRYSKKQHELALARALHESIKRRRAQGDILMPLPQLSDFIEPEM